MSNKLSEKQIKDGWQIVKFGEIAREVKESTKTPIEGGLQYYVGLEHLDPQSLRIARKGVIADDNPSFTRRFSAGHILFGKRRCYQKKAAVADFDGICSGDIIVMEAINGKITPGLLPFIVQSDAFFDWAEKTSSGSLSPRTKWKALAEFEFPLPPLERQKEILEVLEKVEECLIINETVKSKANLLFLSSLISNYNVNTNKGDKCHNYSLEKLAEIRMGSSPPSRAYNDNGQGLPLFQGKTDLIDRRSVPRVYTSQVTKECFVGDILLSVRAPVGYVSVSNHHACIGRGVAALTVKADHDTDYIYYALMAQEHEWQKVSQGGIFAAINSKELKSITIFAPLKNVQIKIASAMKAADNTIKHIIQKNNHYNCLKQKLIVEFFWGTNEL